MFEKISFLDVEPHQHFQVHNENYLAEGFFFFLAYFEKKNYHIK
jgi:hypothetical protein